MTPPSSGERASVILIDRRPAIARGESGGPRAETRMLPRHREAGREETRAVRNLAADRLRIGFGVDDVAHRCLRERQRGGKTWADSIFAADHPELGALVLRRGEPGQTNLGASARVGGSTRGIPETRRHAGAQRRCIGEQSERELEEVARRDTLGQPRAPRRATEASAAKVKRDIYLRLVSGARTVKQNHYRHGAAWRLHSMDWNEPLDEAESASRPARSGRRGLGRDTADARRRRIVTIAQPPARSSSRRDVDAAAAPTTHSSMTDRTSRNDPAHAPVRSAPRLRRRPACAPWRLGAPQSRPRRTDVRRPPGSRGDRAGVVRPEALSGRRVRRGGGAWTRDGRPRRGRGRRAPRSDDESRARDGRRRGSRDAR